VTGCERLSSSQTSFAKIVFPLMWVSALSYLIAAAILPVDFSSRTWGPSGPSTAAQVLVLLIFVLGIRGILRHFLPLKSVRMEDDVLYVSNLFREIAIPIASIRDVEEYSVYNTKRVRLRIEPPSEFGSQVIFIPKAQLLSGLTRESAVQRLQSAVARARTQA
jgi:hypothetical protein